MKSYSDYVAQARVDIDEITLSQIGQWLEDGAVLIDVRELAEYRAGHIQLERSGNLAQSGYSAVDQR